MFSRDPLPAALKLKAKNQLAFSCCKITAFFIYTQFFFAKNASIIVIKCYHNVLFFEDLQIKSTRNTKRRLSNLKSKKILRMLGNNSF